uniref:Uncharacterized protein n=1 Tax=Anguilla anguilla TaxID=7936 RepID=A0A0E9PG08_ANGAN
MFLIVLPILFRAQSLGEYRHCVAALLAGSLSLCNPPSFASLTSQ